MITCVQINSKKIQSRAKIKIRENVFWGYVDETSTIIIFEGIIFVVNGILQMKIFINVLI